MDRDGAERTDRDVLCVLPWVHASVSVDGVWGRCCFDNTNDYDHYYNQATRPDLVLSPNSIGCIPGSEFARDNSERVYTTSEVLNSPEMRRTRLEMLRGEQPAACRHCYWVESLGATSHRQNMNAFFTGKVDLPEMLDATGAEGEVDHQIFSADLRLGNTCGLECIMCSFPTSSRFGRYLGSTWTNSQIDPFRDNDVFWDDLCTIPDVKYLYFAGGEPFMQRSHLPFLDRLISGGYASDIELHYNSNLMQMPAAYLQRFVSFRHVVIAASCDGVGPTFETIRRGALWKTFLENVRKASRLVEVWLDVTVQRDNVMELEKILDIAESESVRARFQNVIFYPPDLSILSLAAKQRIIASRSVERLIERCQENGDEVLVKELRSIYALLSEI